MAADDSLNPGQDTDTSEETRLADGGQTDLNELHIANTTRRRPEEEENQDGQADDKDADRDETSGNLHYGSDRDINLLNEPEPERNAFGTEVEIDPEAEGPLSGAVIEPELGDGTASSDLAATEFATVQDTPSEGQDSDSGEANDAEIGSAEAEAQTDILAETEDFAGGQITPAAAAVQLDETVEAEETAETVEPTPTAPAEGIDEAPTEISLTGGNVAEDAANGTVVGTVAASDPDAGETFTYALTDDAGGRFAVDPDTGEITVADGSLLDFEDAASHNVTVEVTDSAGNTLTQNFDLSLTDTNEAPTGISLSGDTIAEGSANGTAVGTVAASDPDAGETFTYALTDDAGGRFAVNPDTGEIAVADGTLLDFEDAASHNVTVEVTDSAGNTLTQSFDLSLTDTNEAPMGLSLTGDTVAEGSADGTAVGTVAASDPDAGETFTYTLTDDAGGRFAIDETTGEITVADGTLLDFEDAANHNVTVEVTDSAGNTLSQSFDLSLTDTNEAPTGLSLTGDSVAEGSADGTVVGTVAASDPDAGETFTYALTDDAGGRFAVDPNTGEITVADGTLLDFEDAASHNVTVEVTDSAGNTLSQSFDLSLTDTNEAPTGLSLTGDTVAEGSSDGTVVGTVAASDPDAGETFTYALTDDAGGRFAVDPDTGEITVADGTLLDFEDVATHNVTVEVTDSAGNTTSQSFDLSLTDTNEAPTGLSLTGDTIAEGSADGTVIGTVAASDPDAGETFTYALTDDAGGRFAVDPDTGEITVADGTLLDFEDTASHNLTVEVTDSAGNTYSDSFAISVDNANEAPTGLAMAGGSVDENSPGGTVVGTVSATDADAGETFTYALTDDAGGLFAIDPNTGEIAVSDGAALDFESASSHNVTVEVTDSAGNTYSQPFSLAVNDVDETPANQAPTDLALTGGSVDENSPGGTVVGTVSATDADAGETFTYALSDDAGGLFTIDPNTGEIAVADGAALDFESAASHSVTVEVTDSAGNTYSEPFALAVNDVDETPTNQAPTDLAMTGGSVDENSPGGTVVGTVAATDADAGETFTYALTDDADGLFTIDPNTGEIAVADGAALDFESASSHNVTVEVTDSAGNTYSEPFAVAVNDVDESTPPPANQAPTDLAMTGGAVDENSPGGTVVGTVAASDADAGETFTYALTDDAGGLFTIDPDTGEIAVADGAALDFESASSHNVTVEVTDSAGNTYSEPFAVAVNDVDESTPPPANQAPTDLTLDGNLVAEGSPDGILIGQLSATDPDAGETFTYALTDDAGGRFTVNPDSGQISVADGSLIDFNDDRSHDITVEVTDSAGNTYAETFSLDVAETEEAVSGRDNKNDHVTGGEGNDVLDGLNFNDHLEGLGGIDNLIGGGGQDHLEGGAGNDFLDGGTGQDVLDGGDGDGDDVLLGGDGIDNLSGGAGNDVLDGGAGKDRLYGGDGDDTLNGGADNDRLYGEEGNDLFIFQDGGGSDSVEGGAGGGWTDVLTLQDATGGAPTDGWTVAINSGSVVSSGDGFMELSEDAAGTVTMADGSEVEFSEIERIEW